LVSKRWADIVYEEGESPSETDDFEEE